MNSLSNTFISDLQILIPQEAIAPFIRKLKFEPFSSTQYPACQTSKKDNFQMKTPSTASTFLRKSSAISRGKRLKVVEKKSKGIENEKQKGMKEDENCQIAQEIKKDLQRKVLHDRAVFYGNTDLPYLHSSDAINSLYSKNQTKQNQPLINPSPNINPSRLVSVKFLYLYYTNIESLRQLGTGWSNLKGLTVFRSCELRDLGGANIFPNLQYLFVPHNNITEISDVMYHSSLRCVDIEDNMIDLMEQIEYLYTIPLLEWVNVRGNPITNVKQSYRIIAENFGHKMQLEDNKRLEDYLANEYFLDAELMSHESTEVSNHTLKCINNQIKEDDISVQQAWRNSHSRNMDENNIDFVTYISHQNEGNESDEQFLMTPLQHFYDPQIDVGPIKKYFHNKVNVQVSQENAQKSTKQMCKTIINPSRFVEKMSATQNLQAITVSEEKSRLVSSSLKKRKLKFSLPKQTIEKRFQEKERVSDSLQTKLLKKRPLLKRPNLLD